MIYQILIRLLAPLIALLLWRESRKGEAPTFLSQRLWARFGVLKSCDYLIHCASVGEVNAALPLIVALQERGTICVSTNTISGADNLKRQLGDAVQHVYMPFDWPFAVRRLFKAVQPRKLIIMETELWPNLYGLCPRFNIELILANGRLSNKTLNAPSWLKRSYKTALSHVYYCLARSEADKQAWLQLGMAPERVMVAGNIKFAAALGLKRDHAALLAGDYILAASCHEGEELSFVEIIKQQPSSPLLVLAPRHPARREAIIAMLQDEGVVYAVRSHGQSINDETQVYLADTFGELQGFIAHASWVLMCGSFVNKGGHNLLEPAALGAAIVCGPHMQDFEAELALLHKYGAVVQMRDIADLSQQWQAINHDGDGMKTRATQARLAVQSSADVLQCYMHYCVIK